MSRISSRYRPYPLPSLRISGLDVVAPEYTDEEICRYIGDRCSAKVDDAVFAAIEQQCERTPADFFTDCQLAIICNFSISDLRAALRSLRDLAESSDHVQNLMLKRLLPAVTPTLLLVFNYLWHGGQFPDSWRQATVIPILDMNKSSDHSSDYHPISLT